MKKELDEIIYDALTSDSGVTDVVPAARIFSTCVEVPPMDRDNTPLPYLINAEVDVALPAAQHQHVLQLLGLGICSRSGGPRALGGAVEHTAVQGGQHIPCQGHKP